MTHYRILLPYFRQNLSIIVMGVGSLLLVDFLQLLIPRVIKLAVDDLTRYQATSSRLLAYAGMVLALALGIVVFRFECGGGAFLAIPVKLKRLCGIVFLPTYKLFLSLTLTGLAPGILWLTPPMTSKRCSWQPVWGW